MANPNGNPQYLKSWKPGQSGNPNGRPKRKSFIELLHEHIEAQDSEKELIAVFHQMLLEKHQYAWKEFLERRDGKVKEQVELSQALPEIHITLPEKNNEDCLGSPTGPTNRISIE